MEAGWEGDGGAAAGAADIFQPFLAPALVIIPSMAVQRAGALLQMG